MEHSNTFINILAIRRKSHFSYGLNPRIISTNREKYFAQERTHPNPSKPWSSHPRDRRKNIFFQENKPISASPPFPCVNIWPTQYLPFPNSDTQGRWTSQLVLIWMKPASNILSWKIFLSVGNEDKLKDGKNCDEDEFVRLKSGHCPIISSCCST